MSSTDLTLTERGILQAEAAARYLQGIKFDYVFASPLLRARQTAEIIYGKANGIELCDELKEMLFGEVEGLTWEELRSNFPEVCHRSNLSKATSPGGESFGDVVSRCNSFIESKLRPIKDAPNVLIASHGITIRALINCLLNRPMEHVNYLDWADNAAIAEIDLPARKIVRLNDRKHLTDSGLGHLHYEQWALFSEEDYENL